MTRCTTAFARKSRTATVLFAAGLVLSGVAGCDWLVPLAFFEHKEKVPAEFDKLEGHRTAILVWAPQETLFDYPHVRMELALHIADRLNSHVDDIDLVDGREIEDHLERTLTQAADPEEIGRTYNCDFVVYLELLEFQMRDPESPDFLRATIESSVTVYDMRADPDEPRRYELTNVKTEYPETGALLFNDTNAAVVRKQTYEKFAEMVARKFYDYAVDM